MLAKSKGVHCEEESEGSWRQKSAPTNRNCIQANCRGDAAKQAKAQYCTERQDVNAEAIWTESGYTYPERSGDKAAEVRASAEGRTDVRANNDMWYHQKSAEAIVNWKRAAEAKKPQRSDTRTKG